MIKYTNTFFNSNYTIKSSVTFHLTICFLPEDGNSVLTVILI